MGNAPHTLVFCPTVVLLLPLLFSAPAAVAQVRLAGSAECWGRVEIYHNDAWGTVCDADWDLEGAEVVCRQLDCGSALAAPGSAGFGEGTGQIWLDDVACTGSEMSLTECQHDGFGIINCDHGEDVGVICSDRFPAPDILIEPDDEVIRGHSATITCSILNQLHDVLQGNFTLTTASSGETQTSSSNPAEFFVFPEEEEEIYSCQYETRRSGRSDVVTLQVAVTLHQPSISLTSNNRAVVWGPDDAEVTRGSSFDIQCSTSSENPEGAFHLVFSGFNITDSRSAVNYSVSFNFPAAEYEHQGSYSCVYEVMWSAENYTSSPSAPIRVIVTEPLWVVASSAASGVVLLLLLLLLVVCLLHRRRNRVHQPGDAAANQMEEEEEKRDYVNIEPLSTRRQQAAEVGGRNEADGDDHDYENVENKNVYVTCVEVVGSARFNNEEEDDEESSDDEHEYVNAPNPLNSR